MGGSVEIDGVLGSALFDLADGFLCVMDRDLRFLWVNRVRPELTMDDVIGKPLASFLTSETFEEAQRCAARVLQTGKSESFAAHNSIGGNDVWTEGRVGPVPGRPDVLVLTTRNITKERQAEASLREVENTTRGLIEAFPGLMLVIEPGGTIIAASRDAMAALDLTDDTSYGSNLFDKADSDASGARWALARRVVDGGTPVHAVEADDGRVYDTIAYPILNGHGKLKQIALVSRDITEQRRAERELQARRERQVHSDKMQALGTLAAGIAHDFNNLLTPVLIYAQRAAQTDLDAATRSALLDNIVASANRGAALVNQILAYGRADSRDRTPVELCGLIGELGNLLRGTLPSSIHFEVEVPDREIWVYGSAGRIHQALINLCVNAEHAMPDGGTLRVQLGTAAPGPETASRPVDLPDGDYARIRVMDEGCGIPADDLRRIFDPFYSTKPPDRGSGLGLFVVHGVMAEHDGGVTVESTPGVSTTFDLWLPLGSRASAPAEQDDLTKHPTRALSLLLADDEPLVLSAAGECLRAAGHHVKAFTSAGELEEAFTRDPASFDAAIVDYRLADGTGLELARRLRDRRPGLPVLLCTGFVTGEVVEACEDAGIAVLQKPYDSSELLSTVTDALQVAGRRGKLII